MHIHPWNNDAASFLIEVEQVVWWHCSIYFYCLNLACLRDLNRRFLNHVLYKITGQHNFLVLVLKVELLIGLAVS